MADLTLINARVYPMNTGFQNLSGLVVDDGRIQAVLGTNDQHQPPASGKILDLGGRIILPGITDSHLHLRKYAETLARIRF